MPIIVRTNLDTRDWYLARSKLSRSLVYKKNLSLIWLVVFKLGYLFCNRGRIPLLSLDELEEKSQATIVFGKFANKSVFNWSKFNARCYDMFFSWIFDLLFIKSSIDTYQAQRKQRKVKNTPFYTATTMDTTQFYESYIINKNTTRTTKKRHQRGFHPQHKVYALTSETMQILEYSYSNFAINRPISYIYSIPTWIRYRSQMFFKIGLQHRRFPANIAKFLRTAFLQIFPGGCFCIFLKVIKQLLRVGYF